MTTFRVLFISVISSLFGFSASANVDCELQFQGKVTQYRRLDLGHMFGSVNANILQSGRVDSHKVLMGFGCNGTDTTPAAKCSVHLSDASETVDMGGYKRAKSLGSMEFSALIPAVSTMKFGDQEAGEDDLVITCTVR